MLQCGSLNPAGIIRKYQFCITSTLTVCPGKRFHALCTYQSRMREEYTERHWNIYLNITLRNDVEERYEDLAIAIIRQAVLDYQKYERMRKEIEKFFRSDWFAMLTNLSPKRIIELTKELTDNADKEWIYRTPP